MTNPNVVDIPSQGFVFGNKLYNKLKWITIVMLPAVNTLYVALGAVWGLPYVTQVVGTISAFTVFLGVLLGISTKGYNNSEAGYAGDIKITPTSEGKKVAFAFNGDPADLEMFPKVTFKVITGEEAETPPSK